MFTNRSFNAFAGLNTGTKSIANTIGNIYTTSIGNVGIGIKNPTSLLDVNGQINTSSFRTIDLKNTNISCTNFTSINLITTKITCQNITSVNLIIPNTTVNNVISTNQILTNVISTNVSTSIGSGVNITTSSSNIINVTSTNVTSTNVISTNTSTNNISSQLSRIGNITSNNFTGIGTVNTGTILLWPSNSIPSDYILCTGGAISRTDFPALWIAIGTTYGAGNRSTTFNVPDLRGRVPMGRALNLGFDLGYTFGSERVTLTQSQMPNHSHGGLTSFNGGHTHLYQKTEVDGSTAGGYYAENFFLPNVDLKNKSSDTSTEGNHSHNVVSAGGGLSHENMQPFLALNFVIKT